MKGGIEVETYKHIKVYVNRKGVFNTTINDKDVTDNTLEGLHEKMNKQIKEDLKFKPIEAIDASNNRVLKITSLDRTGSATYGVYIWISYTDQYTNKRREKTALGDYWHSQHYAFFYKVTPKNMEILNKIKETENEITALNQRIKELQKTYTDPVTEEDVGYIGEQ